MKVNVFVENKYKEYKIDEVKVFKDIEKISDFIINDKVISSKSCLKGYDVAIVSFDVVLCNNAEIHRVNNQYRKKDVPTDVITFAIFADSTEDERYIFDNETHLGEIVISLDKIKEQAKEYKRTFEDEFYFIVAHGVMHLLGFDHQTEEDFNFMMEHQNRARDILL